MTAMPSLCACADEFASTDHTCEYRTSRWCPTCLADRSDPQCCTPQRLDRIVRVPAKPCGCLTGDECDCYWGR